ncbi:lipase family protein [Leptolyngbya sp. FACHB-261]|uniref:lipase family protein n=1 Tax=Leptolyngbya sp. FACHB-261 TaxID=2692806 RepID=UPI0016886C83|nr:lipase family protein [Leptolyngbya sp. FACHB-261]MBD2099450.1 lipase family protein [Leptolyngbya sp. FACHB-261]
MTRLSSLESERVRWGILFVVLPDATSPLILGKTMTYSPTSMLYSQFEAQAVDYSPINAFCLAKAAQLAYSDSPAIDAQTKLWGFTKERVRFCEDQDTQAFVAANDQIVVLSFRGTTDRNDWATNIGVAFKEETKIGKVHEGFLEALDCVWPRVMTTLDAFQDKNQSLWITGHSLGGALATLATARLRFGLKRPVAGLYTFGSPRAVDEAFADTFNHDFKAQTFRLVHNNDVVTRVPPRSFGYSHVGTFLYIDPKGRIHQDIRFWNNFLANVQGRMSDFLKPGTDGFKDHDIAKYAKHLENNLGKTPEVAVVRYGWIGTGD